MIADAAGVEPELPVEEEQGRFAALNPSLLQAIACYILKMPVRVHHTLFILALAFAPLVLGGCSSINERIGAGVGDALPQWAGGLPSDVPPRRGTPEYEEYMKSGSASALNLRPTPMRPRRPHRRSRRPVLQGKVSILSTSGGKLDFKSSLPATNAKRLRKGASATKQSRTASPKSLVCFAEPAIGRAFARPVSPQ